jgi:hypothetical protein
MPLKEEEIKNLKVGDAITFIYAQPGNDTTYGLVESIDLENKTIAFYDVFFELRVPVLSLGRDGVWLTTEKELKYTVGHHKFGTTTVAKRMEEARKELNL